MSDLVNYKSINIQELMNNIERYKYNPSGIQRVILEYLDEVSMGQIDIVDPTNPFIFLLEASSVNTSLAINESIVNLRKQYPSLAQTEDDLYLHLSDVDFLNRFSTPSETDFTVVIQAVDLEKHMVRDNINGWSKITIARDTEFIIDGLVFTLQYPIDIYKYDNGLVQIMYDSTITTPIGVLTTNIIDYTVRRDSSLVDWIFFKVRVKQFKIETTYFPLQKSISFSQDLPYTDKFYYIRAFYKNNSENWIEFKTTHTDQVYDQLDPTAVIKVFEHRINVAIPTVYLIKDMINGEVRFDVYTTRGNININLSNYKISAFSIRLLAIDGYRDTNLYTAAMFKLPHYIYCDQIIDGGTNGISFEELRKRIIFNTVGEQQLPITNAQVESLVNNNGFDVIKNIDVLTDRIFLATRKLPKPLNTKLLTSANIGISTVLLNLDYLRTLPTVSDNGERLTLHSNNLFNNINGIVNLLNPEEKDAINNLIGIKKIQHINNNKYIFNPYYYVLDTTDFMFEVRIYNLDFPKASNLNFIAQNQTLQLPVNTETYYIKKVANGYELFINTKSGNFYKQLPPEDISMQLAFYAINIPYLLYINGELVYENPENKERTFRFKIDTNYDLDERDNICITNARVKTTDNILCWINLNTRFHVIHATTSTTTTFVPDKTDSMLGKNLLVNSVANTHETIDICFGSSLRNLWSRSRTVITYDKPTSYLQDVPYLYEEDVYETDPVTGSMFTVTNTAGVPAIGYNLLHRKGEQVLDDSGAVVYKHRAGDTIVTENNSLFDSDKMQNTTKELDLLFIDGKYHFITNDNIFIDYKNEIVRMIDTWVVKDIEYISQRLIEQTKIFFYPKTSIGKVKVFTEDNNVAYITSEQGFIVDLYVRETVFNNSEVRQLLINETIILLDEYISKLVINMTDIVIALKNVYGHNVNSLNIKGLGGSANYQVVNIAVEYQNLCLKKILDQQQDGSVIIKEDVLVNFYKVL